MNTDLEYPEILAFWRTVPITIKMPDGSYNLKRKYLRDDWGIRLSVIQEFRPGINLNEAGKPSKYVRKKRDWVVIGPALAIILNRPELTALKGGQLLANEKSNWEYNQNQKALNALQGIVEQNLGYKVETMDVGFRSSDDMRYRIRAGQRRRAVQALEQVLSADEFEDIYSITFDRDDDARAIDLAANPQHWA